jgi:putative nucleotidyltransferase with HDIG domain
MAVLTAPPAQLVTAIDRLEPLPATARKLIAAMRGEDASLTEVARLIEFDQAIAAAVLRMAQSAAFAGMHGAETVREAVMRLGTVRLLNLVLDGYVRSVSKDAPLYDLVQEELWRHGAAAELAVRAMAQERPRLRIPPAAQTAALLHDIGKLVICQCFAIDMRSVTVHAQARGLTFVEAERDLLGVDHASIGGAIASKWQFPDVITEAIALHHAPKAGDPTVVRDAVVVANLVAKTLEVGLGAEGLNFDVDADAFARLTLDFEAFARVCLQTDLWVKELAH